MSNVDQIKSRLNIADVVGSYLKLEKAGVNFKARCPFHNEKTPSFFVSQSRGSWHCFGCDKGGDIFSFVMEIEKAEFLDALKILAKRAGVELKAENPRERNEKNRLLKIMEDAKDFYKNELYNNPAVLDYLKKRGLEKETIKDFELGYAKEDWRNIYDYLLNKGYDNLEIEKTGLIIKSQNPQPAARNAQVNYYDRFRNRIMFPIKDQGGRTIAFCGRGFEHQDARRAPQNTAAKYINSPQTALYDKSRTLFNYNKAKFEIARQNYFVLVEGYMDAIMSHQAGVKNVVAVSGTALTYEHIKLLLRFTTKAVMGLDTDEAGLNATGRGLHALISSGVEVKIAAIKEKDPADAIKKDKKIWQEAVQNAKHIIDFYLSFLKEKHKNDQRAFIADAEKIIFPYITTLVSEMEKSFWIKEIAAATRVKEDTVWEEARKFSARSVNIKKQPDADLREREKGEGENKKQKETKIDYLQKRIISILLFLSSKNKISDELKKEAKNDTVNFSEERWELVKVILEKAVLPKEFAAEAECLAFEAEIIYNQNNGHEELWKKEAEEEVKNLLKLLQKERLRERLEKISYEIKNLEEVVKKGDKSAEGFLSSKIGEFNEISKKISLI